MPPACYFFFADDLRAGFFFADARVETFREADAFAAAAVFAGFRAAGFLAADFLAVGFGAVFAAVRFGAVAFFTPPPVLAADRALAGVDFAAAFVVFALDVLAIFLTPFDVAPT